MKKDITAIALASVLSGFISSSVYAVDGTITFNGQITNASCQVNLTSPGAAAGQNLVVEMGVHSRLNVTNAGDILSQKPISFAVTNCPTEVTQVAVTLEGTADTDDATAFKNTFTPGGGQLAAGGVALKILDNATAVAPGSTTTLVNVANQQANLNYTAQFVATKAQNDVSQGKFQTVVNYTMNYQ